MIKSRGFDMAGRLVQVGDVVVFATSGNRHAPRMRFGVISEAQGNGLCKINYTVPRRFGRGEAPLRRTLERPTREVLVYTGEVEDRDDATIG